MWKWGGVVALVALTICAALITQDEELQFELSQLRGRLYPANDPNPGGCQATGQQLTIYFGDNGVTAEEFPLGIVAISGIRVMTMDRGNDGAIGLTMTIRDETNKVVVEFEDGDFTIKPEQLYVEGSAGSQYVSCKRFLWPACIQS